MKLNAIVDNGSRLKDFVDIYYLLERYSFTSIADAYVQKYPGSSLEFAKRALAYHKDIDETAPLKLFIRTIESTKDLSAA